MHAGDPAGGIGDGGDHSWIVRGSDSFRARGILTDDDVQLIPFRQTLHDAIDDLGDRIKLGVELAARPSANLKASAR